MKKEKVKREAVRHYMLSRFKEHARTRKIMSVKKFDADHVDIAFEGNVTLRLNRAEAEAVKVKEVLE